MERLSIYEDIGRRTDGDIYIGVVGPVRAGKSTFIKRFMDLMVLPNVSNSYDRQRIMDEMPQSGSGKTITTTEPKFIPAQAVSFSVGEIMNMRVRLVDCVGYLIPQAIGHMEEDGVRMVNTPWSEDKIPFEDAASIGTSKVIEDHATIAMVITTDGSIGTMNREDYIEAEHRAIEQLMAIGKPFTVVVNSTDPSGASAQRVASEIQEKYGVPVVAMNCARASETDIEGALALILERFPVKEIAFELPAYIDGLDWEHWVKGKIRAAILSWAGSMDTVEEVKNGCSQLADGEFIERARLTSIDMGEGEAQIKLEMAAGLYYKVITELMGEEISDDREFFSRLREFADSKRAYDKLRDAMGQVEDRGYGIVKPKLKEMVLEEPEVFKQGNKYGVRIVAKAPTLHIIETDISTEISPVVGSEIQSEELVASLREDMENNPKGIWETNILGKSLYEMATEQMESKIAAVPDNIRHKMRKSLQKISDEGREYFICIVI